MNAWYATLHRPPLTPPDWIFSPVWTALYLALAVAFAVYYRSAVKPRARLASGVLLLHLAANFSWTVLFFGLRSPALALADLVFLDLSLLVLIRLFWLARPLAGVLLLPYLLWMLFATYLNIGFLVLN